MMQVRHLPADGIRAGPAGPRRVAVRAPGRGGARGVARAARPGDAPCRHHDVQPQAAPGPRRLRPAGAPVSLHLDSRRKSLS